MRLDILIHMLTCSLPQVLKQKGWKLTHVSCTMDAFTLVINFQPIGNTLSMPSTCFHPQRYHTQSIFDIYARVADMAALAM